MQTATVQWVGKQQFVQRVPSGHAIVVDSDRDRQGGRADGMVLMALGTARQRYGDYFGEKRQLPEAIEVICSGERARSLQQVW